jgi:hypothetical protein
MKLVYVTQLALEAAAAAYRVQGERYIKSGEARWDEESNRLIHLTSNRQIMIEFLENPTNITEQDRAMAGDIRREYQTLSFKLLGNGRLSDIEHSSLKIIDSEQITARDLGLVAYLPQGYHSAVEQRKINEILENSEKTPLAEYGKRITVTGRIIRSFWSKNWSVYFVTVVADTGHSVSFATKDKLDVDSNIEVRGTVKGQRDGVTQLSRPKTRVL